MTTILRRRKAYSTFSVKQRSFAIGLTHSLQDAANSLVPILVAGAAASFLVWFWGNGPVGLFQDLFQIKVTDLLWARILSTIVVGFPTLVFVRSSFVNFLRVMSDPRPMERDLVLLWEEIRDKDLSRKE